MKKQHELLAYETDHNKHADLITVETKKVFNDSANFDEHIKSYLAFNDSDKDIGETSEKKMTTTVQERLSYHAKAITKSFNTMVSKERTNQQACADIIVFNDEGDVLATIAKNVPVCALLSLEKKLNEQRKVYSSIPTVATQINWKEGINMAGAKCYIADATKKIRTRTETITERFDQGVSPNGKHPQFVPRDKKVLASVGEYTTIVRSGRITPKEKADMMERIDSLIAAVKIARSKANSIEVIEEKDLGKAIFDFINI